MVSDRISVDDILLSGSDDEQVLQVVEKLKDSFETVELEDAKFLLGVGIHRNVHARNHHFIAGNIC